LIFVINGLFDGAACSIDIPYRFESSVFMIIECHEI
jgi:hypothetical protein